MIRIVSAALLLVVLVGVLSGSASAECAWVLWVKIAIFQTSPVDSGESSFPRIASETKAECESTLRDHWERERDRWLDAVGETKVNPDQSVSTVRSHPGFVEIARKGPANKIPANNLLQKTTYSYQCWPDTIDPRGPKGK